MVIFQLRTYWAASGKVEPLHARFRDLTVGLFARHGMEMVGFWVPNPITAESGDLVYMLRFADEAAMDKAWDGFRNDPDWVAGKAASEVDGPLVVRITNYVLTATDYSP